MKKREDLVQSAFDLFYRQGFHATGVDQLSREGNVTKRTLYRYFETKEDLVQAALRHRDERFFAKMRARIEAEAPSDRAAAYVEFIIEWTRESDFHGCAFINAAAEFPAASDAAHTISAEHKALLREYLTSVCCEAGLQAPESAALQLFLLGEGLTVAAQVSGPDEALEREARALAAGLTRVAQ